VDQRSPLVTDRTLALGVDHAGRHWRHRHNQHEHCANDGRLHNLCESLTKVDSRVLTEDTDNPSSLVIVEGAIGVEFIFENSFAEDDMSFCRLTNKSPCPVADENLTFIGYGYLCEKLIFIGYLCEICSMCENIAI
jgi:hypothetical protein